MPGDARAAFQSIVAAIRRLAASGDLPQFLTDHPLSPNTQLADLGLDSLGRLLLVEEVTSQVRGYVPDDRISDDMTLDELSTLVTSESR